MRLGLFVWWCLKTKVCRHKQVYRWMGAPVAIQCFQARNGETARFIPCPAGIADDIGAQVVPIDCFILAYASPGFGSRLLTPRTASTTACMVPMVISLRH